MRWHVCDSLTGRIVGRLHPNSWDITEEPRASSVGNLTVPLPGDPAAVDRLRNLLRPGDRRPHARAVALEDPNTGKVLFYGPIVSPPQRSGPEIAVPVVDWSAWFRQTVIRPSGATFTTTAGRDYIVTNREQALIMTDLFARALEATAGNPNIVIDAAPTTGVNRARTAKLFAKVGEHLDEIANLSNGCEWYTYGTRDDDSTSIVAHVAVAWPERGGGQIPVRLSYRQDLNGNRSGNVDTVSWPGGGEGAATRIWATDGADPVALYGWGQSPTVGSVDIIWEDTIDLADGTTNKATATARAKGELRRVVSFDGTVDLTVNARVIPFAKLQVGDRARVEIADMWNLVQLGAVRIVKRVMSGGAGRPDLQVLTVDLDDNRFPFGGDLPGTAVEDNGVT